jgi:hypothetical protein
MPKIVEWRDSISLKRCLHCVTAGETEDDQPGDAGCAGMAIRSRKEMGDPGYFGRVDSPMSVVPEQRQRPASIRYFRAGILLERLEWRQTMSRNRLILAVSDWCKRTAARWRMTGSEKPSQVAQVSCPVHVNFIGNSVELGQVAKALKIGDRVRVHCNDGLLVAEKISETQFQLIDAQPLAELVN